MDVIRSVYAVKATEFSQPFIAMGSLAEAMKIVSSMHRDEESYDYASAWKYIVEIPVFGSFSETGDGDE